MPINFSFLRAISKEPAKRKNFYPLKVNVVDFESAWKAIRLLVSGRRILVAPDKLDMIQQLCWDSIISKGLPLTTSEKGNLVMVNIRYLRFCKFTRGGENIDAAVKIVERLMKGENP
jgi:hypothetical protein